MGYRLFLYLFVLFIGIFIGYKEITHVKLLKSINKLQMISLIILLFVMGIRIGCDKIVILNIGELGYMATIIAVFSILFSIIMVYLLRKLMLINEKGEKKWQ